VNKKISIVGTGNVGATIAYTLTSAATASEIVLIDINKDKALGEALDIVQGTPFAAPINIYAGDYSDAVGSDIVIVVMGMARKPGQTRLDLAQMNVDITLQVVPEILKYAPDAIYMVVSNPVDILTYTIIKSCGVPANRVIGSGTMLDTSRLINKLAQHVKLNPQNVTAYVFGEHGDSSMIPWSLASIVGMEMNKYCDHICEKQNQCGKKELKDIEDDVRRAGAEVIKLKGATYYAIALAVREMCDTIYKNVDSVLTVSSMINGRYGIYDVCLSLPFIINAKGIVGEITPPLTELELNQLRNSADVLKETISSLRF